MEYVRTAIPDVVLIKPKVFGDYRGFFLETYREEEFNQVCGTAHFVQDNHSGSQQGILRGLHFQLKNTQGKLVRAAMGEIFDVAVDLRQDSPTFGKWVGEILSAENRHQIWIPAGFAHGFYVISEWAEVIYKATDYYTPEWERGMFWNDPEIGIEWPLVDGNPPILSKKDAVAPKLAEAEVFPAGWSVEKMIEE